VPAAFPYDVRPHYETRFDEATHLVLQPASAHDLSCGVRAGEADGCGKKGVLAMIGRRVRGDSRLPT
jgi:hypothetical protein